MGKPKYSEVENWIKNEIYCGNFVDGEKIPSENTLMRQFGYSRQTIRLALRNLEESGILRSVRGSGTYVEAQRSKDNNEKKTIGVILNSLERRESAMMLDGIESVLTKNNAAISLGVSHNRYDREYEVLQSMLETDVDGFIIEGAKNAIMNPNSELLLRICKQRPCVFLNGVNSTLNDIPSVAGDDAYAGYIAAKYLMERGHRDIATISRMDSLASHKRYGGYIRALNEAGIPFDDSNMMWCLYENMGEIFDELIGNLFLKNLYKCTAVMCHNDTIARSLIGFLVKINLKPFDDVSIISFENSAFAENNRITSVGYDYKKIGEDAAKLCLDIFDKKEKRHEILIPPVMMPRDSVRVLSRE